MDIVTFFPVTSSPKRTQQTAFVYKYFFIIVIYINNFQAMSMLKSLVTFCVKIRGCLNNGYNKKNIFLESLNYK